MKRFCLLLLCLCLLGTAVSAGAEKRESFPEMLRVTQQQAEREYIRSDVYITRTYPDTVNAKVNAEMTALINDMTAKGRSCLPAHGGEVPAYLDVGAYLYRSGEKYLSFLTVARIAAEYEQTYVDFDARAYDMETGMRLTMADLFPDDSPAWDVLAQAVREQLTAYYPALTPDEGTLDILCRKNVLRATAFTLSAAKLCLHYRADALYPGKNTLMHVNLYYRDIRPYMTETAQAQTDNSNYKLIALTYDDGGARSYSMNTIDQLRLYGANATFFVVGTTFYKNHDVLCREQDAGFSVQSHNYEHVYQNLNADNIFNWKEKQARQLSDVTGSVPTLMRPPGGIYGPYQKAQVGYPLILWSVLSNDSGNGNAGAVAATVINHARDGAVVLLHDLNPVSYKYSSVFLPNLISRGFQCVTVDELFAHYGVELQPNVAYYGCEEQANAAQ